MENGEPTSSGATPDVVVRDFAPADRAACRLLWVELTEHHRRIYEDPSIGGDDPGTGLDDHLALPERLVSWVADLDGRVVGLTGLLDRGAGGEVEPVVPVARNVSAIQRFHRAGFQTLGGQVDLTMDLADRRHRWLDGAQLHGLDLRY